MTSISQLPSGSAPTGDEEVPVVQAGKTVKLPLSDFLNGVSSFNTRSGEITLSGTDVETALGFTPASAISLSSTATIANEASTVAAEAFTLALNAQPAIAGGSNQILFSPAETGAAPIPVTLGSGLNLSGTTLESKAIVNGSFSSAIEFVGPTVSFADGTATVTTPVFIVSQGSLVLANPQELIINSSSATLSAVSADPTFVQFQSENGNTPVMLPNPVGVGNLLVYFGYFDYGVYTPPGFTLRKTQNAWETMSVSEMIATSTVSPTIAPPSGHSGHCLIEIRGASAGVYFNGALSPSGGAVSQGITIPGGPNAISGMFFGADDSAGSSPFLPSGVTANNIGGYDPSWSFRYAIPGNGETVTFGMSGTDAIGFIGAYWPASSYSAELTIPDSEEGYFSGTSVPTTLAENGVIFGAAPSGGTLGGQDAAIFTSPDFSGTVANGDIVLGWYESPTSTVTTAGLIVSPFETLITAALPMIATEKLQAVGPVEFDGTVTINGTIQSAGEGASPLNLQTANSAATSPSSFSATHIAEITIGGTIFYFPCSASPW